MSDPTTTPPSDTSSSSGGGGDVVARAGTYYRNTRYLIALGLVAMGCWFGYDGFKKWPADNARIAELRKERTDAERANDQERLTEIAAELSKIQPRTDSDIRLQRILFFTLPPLGIALLIWALYNSRGEFRLTPADVLHVPGHPPIPIDNMTALDRRLWDRKGIAHVEYELPGDTKGKFRLDDFIYQRRPIDDIYDRILAKLDPEAYMAAKAESASASTNDSTQS
jgi:hypothetical protein